MPDEVQTEDVKEKEGTTDPKATEQNPEEKEVKITDETLLEINGEQISVKDLRSGFMKSADYTQKTQSLADDKRTLEDSVRKLEERETAVNNLLTNPQDLLKLVVAQNDKAAARPALNDEDVVTVATLRPILSEALGALQNESKKALTKAEQDQVLREFESVAGDATEEVFRRHPKIKDRTNVRDTLRIMARELKPQDIPAMRQAIIASGDTFAKEYNLEEEVVVQKTINGIEPPGGYSPPPAPDKTYLKQGGRKVDWRDIDKDVVTALNKSLFGK